MKALVCEMCSGRELVKQDGYFICQNCGTKYSIEEAKKLMVEIEGAVKIDNSDFVQRYLQNARRAIGKEDWAEVEKYYNMVEQNEPDNIEAIFYSAYGKAKQSLVEEDIYKRQAVFKTLTNSVSILDDNYDVAEEAQLKEILERITDDVIGMFGSSFVFTQTKNGNGTVTGDNKSMTHQLFINLACEMVTTLGNILQKFPGDKQGEVVYIHKLRLKVAEKLATSYMVSNESKKTWVGRCRTMCDEIKRYEPGFSSMNYDAVLEQIEKNEKANAIGCLAGGIIAIAFIVFIVVICCM